jgi:hypothetical protein
LVKTLKEEEAPAELEAEFNNNYYDYDDDYYYYYGCNAL